MPALRARRSRFRLLVAALCLAAPLLAAAPPAPAPPPAHPLSAKHAAWLEDVALLLRPEERQAFLALSRDYQRDAFIERFWQVRDPYPETARNELRDAWEERTKSARQRWGSLADERAGVLLLAGEPASVRPGGCRGVVQPLEIWHFGATALIHHPFELVFVLNPGPTPRPARLWHPTASFAPLLLGPSAAATPAEFARELQRECAQADELLGDLQSASEWDQVAAESALIPKPSLEWLQAFQARTTDLPPGAEPLPATLSVDFPGRYQSRTVVEAVLAVPADAPRYAANGKASFLVDGEVLLHDELFESFRYRFDLARDPAGGPLPLLVQRYLRPGEYTLVVRLEDLEGHRFFRDERPLQVPAVAATPAAAPPGPPAMAEAHAASTAGEQVVKLLAPPPELLETGRVRFDAVTQGDGIARVAFALDGKPVMTKATPPYSVELDLGRAPRTHTLRATALDGQGKELATDEIVVNGGPHRFAVRLIEPHRGGRYQASVLARAEVQVPAQETLDRVEFFLNDTRLATLYQPPFAQPMLIPPGAPLAYVRVVAYLDDGTTAEDLVFVNSPDNAEEVKVDLVELYATALDRRGRLVEDLHEGDFRVREDGKEQQIRRFEMVRDLPIHAGVALDVSASMTDKLDEAVRAALRFFQVVVGPRDLAAVVTFNERATLAVPFTHRQEVLAGSLAHLVADGETALYDAVIYSLHYFNGIKGRRALVLITDGQDTKSRYKFAEAIEYARRTGVAVYAVGLGLEPRDVDVRALLTKLGEETGGRAFFIDHASELDRVYAQVQSELRSQYLIAYQSTGQGDKFRSVEVQATRPGIEIKTIRGYYP